MSGRADDQLDEWLRHESPVERTEDDLFNFNPLAEKLYERLRTGENTIALQGYFGSGKSSAMALTRSLCDQEKGPLLFIQISCWGFDDATKAQDKILEQLLSEINNEVEIFAVRNIPKDYLEALGKQASWAQSLIQLWQGALTAVQQLQRISPILIGIGKTAVVFVEDLDRNSPSFDLTQIQALLVRFRAVKGISFVLPTSPKQAVDFSRLCEFIELMPGLGPEQSLPIVHRVRDRSLLAFPVGVILDKLEPLTSEDDDYSILYKHLDYYWPWALCISSLLNTPRRLKQAMRRVVASWPKLSGEVKIDDLIGMETLRAGAPEAYEFFVRRQAMILASGKPDAQHLTHGKDVPFRKGLIKEWKRVCKRAEFDTRSAALILFKICPASGAITGVETAFTPSKQSGQSSARGELYLRRLISERVEPDRERDQTILSLLVAAKSSQQAIRVLAETICGSKNACEAFEEFALELGFKDNLLPLLSEVYSVIRERLGPRVNREEVHGFFAPWRLFRRENHQALLQQWLVQELGKCAPHHLHLLNEIYYFWLGTDEHSFQERLEPRRAVYEKLKGDWPKLSPEHIAAGFDPGYPYVLFHLFFTSDYKRPETVPFGNDDDWAWVGPILLDAMRANPAVLVPQILIAVNAASERDSERPRYEFDDHRLELWFGHRKQELFEIVSNDFQISPEFAAQTQFLVQIAIDKAKERKVSS